MRTNGKTVKFLETLSSTLHVDYIRRTDTREWRLQLRKVFRRFPASFTTFFRIYDPSVMSSVCPRNTHSVLRTVTPVLQGLKNEVREASVVSRIVCVCMCRSRPHQKRDTNLEVSGNRPWLMWIVILEIDRRHSSK